MDNLKSIINSLSIDSNKNSRSGALFSGLAKQRAVLQNQRGKSASAEEERLQTLQQLEDVLSDADIEYGAAFGSYGEETYEEMHDEYDSAYGVSPSRIAAPQGINRYLESNEALQNDFNNDNKMNFIIGNGGSGVGSQSELMLENSADKFNFALPTPAKPQTAAPKFKMPAQKKSEKLQERLESLKQQQASPRQSLLLERREQNKKSQVDKANEIAGKPSGKITLNDLAKGQQSTGATV